MSAVAAWILETGGVTGWTTVLWKPVAQGVHILPENVDSCLAHDMFSAWRLGPGLQTDLTIITRG
jgi:hypothetical protein